MSNLTLIIGIGIVLAILTYMFFKLSGERDEEGGNKHFLFQILILVFMLACLLLIAKVTLDDSDFCDWNVANTTEVTNQTTNTTTISYINEYQCSTNTNNTSLTFYKAMTYFIIIVSFYVFIYVFNEARIWIVDWFGKR